MKIMEFGKQRNVIDKLNKYDYLANDSDYISVSEWTNGEGYDIDINGKEIIHLSVGELEGIYYLSKSIDYNRDKYE